MRNKLESIESFYNSIAGDYESQLTADDSKAREEISRLFRANVSEGIILDFGGGTGLDLPWLLSTPKYRIMFLEPSSKMREHARRKYKDHGGIVFIDTNLNFNDWSPGNLPFKEKVDGVIANFAVMNCIKNIKEVFSRLSLICKQNGHLIITVINPQFLQVQKNYSIRTAIRLFYQSTLTILNNREGVYHETYLHSIRTIRNASKGYFELKSISPVRFSNFLVVTLVKK